MSRIFGKSTDCYGTPYDRYAFIDGLSVWSIMSSALSNT